MEIKSLNSKNKGEYLMYKNKKVLVAGGTGTIGIPLIKKLIELKANVTVVSMDSVEYAKTVLGDNVSFMQMDLTNFNNCLRVTKNQDYVFNLVGIKGSTGIGETKVASYFVPMLRFQTNLMEASFRNDISRYLFVSSVCAYPQLSFPKEEDCLWNGLPKQNDRIPGLAKRIGEIQGEAYLQEHGWDAVRIVRPSNVYGPFDDFDPATAQVIPALIRRMIDGENPIKVWGDGSAVRDFIFSEELADWILVALEKAPPCVPINLGSGKGVTIKELAETIAQCVPEPPQIEWDTTKPSGDPVRILSMERAKKLMGFKLKTDLKEGIKKTVDWYLDNEELANQKKGYILTSKERQFLLPLAELIDRLTIGQIKEVLIPENKKSYAQEMQKLAHDIDLMIEEGELKLSARLIRIIIVLSQMNLHIWYNKDKMQNDQDHYLELLKFAHQLNGIRNQMKNLLLEETGDKEKSAIRTNFNTDNLKGWDISIE
ncbi:NAD-dependent epimerase/dehydratase family protein [Candidatus Woesearchaeota archaeon]|nr:NAD-dependent epimerase/dehydratase family protein [Candidatus Woesearchaeota archaeon]